MKIKRVEILGFKSFVDRTALDFQAGVTAVLGPNGCGKSNIVDAIRWAMGEQHAKNLRGRSMEDVIFGGSESRKPLGMAEVTLIFSNEDGLAPAAFREYAEIMVTRRLYRDGESEYLINKTPCRLRDIAELFMDTGVGARAYSIIEQGKIGMILNAKPEERRFLIEEAAGVTKFKSRKKMALRKIEATRHNLVRLGDIVAEVRRHLGSLKRQAQKAQRFRDYREELKGIETGFARRRFFELKGEVKELAGLEDEQSRALEGIEGELNRGELTLEELKLVQITAEKEVSRGQERVYHLTSEVQKIEGRIGFGGREGENLGRQQERLAAESEQVSRRLADTAAEEAELKREQADLGGNLQRRARLLVEAEGQLEELAAQEQALFEELEARRRSLYAMLTELSRMGAQFEEAGRRLESQKERSARNRTEAVQLQERSEESFTQAATLQQKLEELRMRRSLLQLQREELQERTVTLRRRLEENEQILLARREELSRHSSRLESLRQLEQSLEGYGTGVRELLGDTSLRGRCGGMAADALEVPKRYETAVEAVLGERLQALLLLPGNGPQEFFARLRQIEGRCTLLLPGFSPSHFPPVPQATPLFSLVTLRGGSEEPLAALLAGAFLVENFQPYLAGGVPPGVTLVTEAGEVLTFRGEFSGGRQGAGQGLLHKKREMKELAEQVERLAGEVVALQELRGEMREGLARCEEDGREVEAGLHRQELTLVDSEKDLARIRSESEHLQERLEVLSLEEDQLQEERQELERRLEEASLGRLEKEARQAELEQSVARFQEELQVLKGHTGVVREQVTSLKVVVAGLREREEGCRGNLERLERLREELLGRRVVLDGSREEAERELARLRTEKERLGTELEILGRRKEEEAARLEGLRERFEQGNSRIEEQEEVLKVLRSRLSQGREHLSGLQLRRREFGLEIEHLCASMLERFRIDLAEAPLESSDHPWDGETAERRRDELRQLIDALGEVNLTAIDEYSRLEERAAFLSAQQDDLRQSLEGLQTAIHKINRTTKKRFRETFDQVNTKFKEVFPRLFRGGRAELVLTDEQDLLETGIEIVAQPPGKKLQNVNLLSGGEKALAAVALIFSIFLIKPSPFCMLDEVDAPLDEANIGRFNEIVQEMADFSQFIIITHNKRTMEIADILYGVTMEEPGISKLVSVRVNQLSA